MKVLILSFIFIIIILSNGLASETDKFCQSIGGDIFTSISVKDRNTNRFIGDYEVLERYPIHQTVWVGIRNPWYLYFNGKVWVRIIFPINRYEETRRGNITPDGGTAHADLYTPPDPIGGMVTVTARVYFTGVHTGECFFSDTSRYYYVDLNPPQLSINSPTDGTVVKAGTEGFQIVVNATDDVGIKDFTIKVDGVVRDTINAREDKPNLTQYLRAMVFGSGRRMITVVARDKVDRTDEKSFFVYSDDAPPTISNVWPPPAPTQDPHKESLRTRDSLITIRADVVDRGMAGVKEVRLLDEMNRVLATRNRPYEGNTYVFDYTRKPGERGIICYIQAFDKVGNMSRTNMINITFEEAPPPPPGGGVKRESIRKPIIPK